MSLLIHEAQEKPGNLLEITQEFCLVFPEQQQLNHVAIKWKKERRREHSSEHLDDFKYDVILSCEELHPV